VEIDKLKSKGGDFFLMDLIGIIISVKPLSEKNVKLLTMIRFIGNSVEQYLNLFDRKIAISIGNTNCKPVKRSLIAKILATHKQNPITLNMYRLVFSK